MRPLPPTLSGQLRGHSVVEMLLGLGLLSTVLGVGLPSLNRLVEQTRTTSELNSLIAEVGLLRSAAAKNRVRATLCPLATDGGCGTDWNAGRLAFLDNNGDGQRTPDEAVLLQISPNRSIALRWRAPLGKAYVQLLPNGLTTASNGTFTLCTKSQDVNFARALIIARTGRVRPSQDRNGDGIHEDASGKPLSCA